MYSIYVVQQDGILSQADIDNNVPVYGSQQAGDPRYVDANGDGVIDADDRVIVGHPNPDFIWGLPTISVIKSSMSALCSKAKPADISIPYWVEP